MKWYRQTVLWMCVTGSPIHLFINQFIYISYMAYLVFTELTGFCYHIPPNDRSAHNATLWNATLRFHAQAVDLCLTYIYIYIYIYVCVCVCMCIWWYVIEDVFLCFDLCMWFLIAKYVINVTQGYDESVLSWLWCVSVIACRGKVLRALHNLKHKTCYHQVFYCVCHGASQ